MAIVVFPSSSPSTTPSYTNALALPNAKSVLAVPIGTGKNNVTLDFSVPLITHLMSYQGTINPFTEYGTFTSVGSNPGYSAYVIIGVYTQDESTKEYSGTLRFVLD